MEEYDKTLTDYFKENYAVTISNILVRFKNTDMQYRKLLISREDILRENPKLRTLVDDFKLVELDKKELEILPKLLDLEEDIRSMEEKEIFENGMLECSKILKSLKIV